MTERDSRLRFEVPLYTITEAARIVDVPVSTLTTWAQGYVRRFKDRPDVSGDPIVTYVEPEGPRRPAIPFVGLTEATVLAAVRRSGVPMQRIRPSLEALEERLGLEHALASKSLYTDGAELLYDFGSTHSDQQEGRAALELATALTHNTLRSRPSPFWSLIASILSFSIDQEHPPSGGDLQLPLR